MTRIGVVTESGTEARVAATPETVKHMVGLGYEVAVEAGAGAKASFPDAAYVEAGASIVPTADAFASDLVLKVNAPTDAEIAMLRPGAIVIGLLMRRPL